MSRIQLRVIPRPDPETRIVLTLSEGGLKGSGDLHLACGVCDETLAAGVPDDRFDRFRSAVIERYLRAGQARVRGPAGEDAPLVLRCPTCGAYNELAAPEDPKPDSV